MRSKLATLFDREQPSQLLFNALALLTLLSIFLGIASEMYFLAGLPAAIIVAYLAIVDFRKLFFLLLVCVPLSTEIVLPNGFGTDLPTEPLMVGLMLIYFLYVLKNGAQLSARFLRHPITLLLLLHFGWILVTTALSDLPFVSIKFSLAKTWYITVFYFMAGSLLKTVDDIKAFFWAIFIPLLATVLITLARHAAIGFSFEEVHTVFYPFHRNHVNYAGILALFFPITVLATQWYKRGSFIRNLLFISLAIFFVAIYFSFTRAAYVAIVIALGYYFIIRMRLTKPLVVLTVLGIIFGSSYMVYQNRYLDYAPNFERTITHTEFNNLIEATYQMEDISTMERVYRWVAGGHMVATNPLFGFGPGNFVNFYKSHTVTDFQTYVSDNEDLSGIHSYYLMTTVEQGIVGLAIFLLLVFYTLIKGEQVYHQTTNLERRRVVLMMLLALIVIDAFQIINDLLETDKIGPFFFLTMAVLVNCDLTNRSESVKIEEEKA
ncbi:MAG: O-antigen ligase family protein [Saprospiraceae bacterium]